LITSLDELKTLINRHHLQHLESQIIDIAKPCLHIEKERVYYIDALPLGTSRLGGIPDVPEDFEWPTREDKPLTFIMQLRLSDLAQYDLESVLPTNGWLYYFYDVDKQPWGFHGQESGWSVTYIKDETTKLSRISYPKTQHQAFELKALPLFLLSFNRILSVPSAVWEHPYGYQTYHALAFNDYDEENAYMYFSFDFSPEASPSHQILGYANHIQYAVEYDCFMAQYPEHDEQSIFHKLNEDSQARSKVMDEWQFLFQIDSDEDLGLICGDMGMLYICIPKDSLAKHQFDDCWTILQCS